MPAGATKGSIRNRISALRVKQRNLYEERGWELPDGAAGHSAKKAKATPSKRASDEDGEPETPSKKPRADRKKKTAISQTPERKDSGAEGEDDDEKLAGVKVEPEEV